MSTIESLVSSIIQNASNQVLGLTTSNVNQPQSTTSGAAASMGTTVTLGSTASISPIYNSLGQLTSTQVIQLEQAINTEISNTIATLFSDTSTNSSATSSLDSTLASLAALPSSTLSTTNASQAAQAVLNSQNVVNSTLVSMFSSISGADNSSNSSSTDLYSLLGNTSGVPNPASSATQTSLQSAISSAQNAVSNSQIFL